MPDFPFVLLYVLLALMIPVGQLGRGRPWRSPVLGVVLVLACALAAWLAIASRDPEVTATAFAEGLLLAMIGLGAFPVLILHAAGRLIGDHPWAFIAATLISLAPLYVYVLLATLAVVDLAGCPVDAYECPI